MERCDFSIVVTTMRRYISDDYNLNQCDFLDSLFCSFFFANEEEEEPKIFDFGLMCRWINGQKRISPAISSFYMKEKK